jgi:hypothetical protein
MSSNGNIFINKKGQTTLTARLYSGREEIDAEALGYEFWWYKSDNLEEVRHVGKSISFDITNSEQIDYMGTYICEAV